MSLVETNITFSWKSMVCQPSCIAYCVHDTVLWGTVVTQFLTLIKICKLYSLLLSQIHYHRIDFGGDLALCLVDNAENTCMYSSPPSLHSGFVAEVRYTSCPSTVAAKSRGKRCLQPLCAAGRSLPHSSKVSTQRAVLPSSLRTMLQRVLQIQLEGY